MDEAVGAVKHSRFGLRPPNADVKRAFPAMRAAGRLVANYAAAQNRVGQPMRHHPPEHSALVPECAALGTTLAGDDQNQTRAAMMHPVDEREERRVSLGLSHAMQVDPAVDLGATPAQIAGKGLFDPRKRQKRPASAWQRRDSEVFGRAIPRPRLRQRLGQFRQHPPGKRNRRARNMGPERAILRRNLRLASLRPFENGNGASALHDPIPSARAR